MPYRTRYVTPEYRTGTESMWWATPPMRSPPKRGSVAHYTSYTIVDNLIREIDGHEPLPSLDGHATCFLASSFE